MKKWCKNLSVKHSLCFHISQYVVCWASAVCVRRGCVTYIISESILSTQQPSERLLTLSAVWRVRSLCLSELSEVGLESPKKLLASSNLKQRNLHDGRDSVACFDPKHSRIIFCRWAFAPFFTKKNWRVWSFVKCGSKSYILVLLFHFRFRICYSVTSLSNSFLVAQREVSLPSAK